MYIVIEGTVGTGKSTQAKMLYEHLLKQKKHVILTREPGGTEISEVIRKTVQGSKFDEDMHPECEAYLYAAARSQSLRTVVKPVLEKKGYVISDRSFVTSLAYQGYARGLGINRVMEINKIAVEGIMPDAIIFLNLDPEKGLNRTFDKIGDKFENEDADFFRKVARGYDEVSKLPEFKRRWIEVDASGDMETVFKRLLKGLSPYIKD